MGILNEKPQGGKILNFNMPGSTLSVQSPVDQSEPKSPKRRKGLKEKIPPKSPMRSPKPPSNKNKNLLSGTIGAKRALKKFKTTGNKGNKVDSISQSNTKENKDLAQKSEEKKSTD